jgi:14-3-3 protein epsilon
MKEIEKAKKEDLTPEERTLLFSSLKNCVSTRLTSYRSILNLVTQEQQLPQSTNTPQLLILLKIFDKELKELCKEALETLDSLLKKDPNDESKVFYFKTKGEYHRYIAECKSDSQIEDNKRRRSDNKPSETKQTELEKAEECYKNANEHATKLSCTNPIKLALDLSYSEFYYEIKKDTQEALRIAKESFNVAVQLLEKVEDGINNDSIKVLHLIKDNIDKWEKEVKVNEEQQKEKDEIEEEVIQEKEDVKEEQ